MKLVLVFAVLSVMAAATIATENNEEAATDVAEVEAITTEIRRTVREIVERLNDAGLSKREVGQMMDKRLCIPIFPNINCAITAGKAAAKLGIKAGKKLAKMMGKRELEDKRLVKEWFKKKYGALKKLTKALGSKGRAALKYLWKNRVAFAANAKNVIANAKGPLAVLAGIIAPGSEVAIATALAGASSFADLWAALGKREVGQMMDKRLCFDTSPDCVNRFIQKTAKIADKLNTWLGKRELFADLTGAAAQNLRRYIVEDLETHFPEMSKRGDGHTVDRRIRILRDDVEDLLTRTIESFTAEMDLPTNDKGDF